MKKTLFYATVLLATCFSLWWYFFNTSIVHQQNGRVYYLRPGLSKRAMITELYQQGILSIPAPFVFYSHLHPQAELKTGEYFFPKGSTFRTIWQQVTKGTGFFYHAFTIIPGWSFTQLRDALQQAQSMRHLTVSLGDTQIMERLGHAEWAPEGQFFPETYYYTLNVSDLVILKRAFDLMQNKLREAWEGRIPELPYKNQYEALIAASLIEKEAYLNIERPMIAGVLVNRLKKGMLLQFDPTVIYGLGNRYTGKIYKKDLLEDTAYNTYVHKGLPPTPIAMPSMFSIEAAMHPQQNNYYYFVAKGDGSHQFSATLLQHHEAVKNALSEDKHEQR